MAAMANQHLEALSEALRAWTDQRFISREDIEAYAMFGMYLVNLLEDQGFDLYGHSWKNTGRLGCLVVKVDHEGTPQVAFTNARTYIGCIRTFLRRLDEGRVDWRADRFR